MSTIDTHDRLLTIFIEHESYVKVDSDFTTLEAFPTILLLS